MKRFSVIIPLYNKAAHIKKTLQSVLNQTFIDFEVIVVNDGSTDNSLEQAQKLQDERLQFFSKPNEGVSVARNFGASKAKGSYLLFLDADDLWENTHLNLLNTLIKDYPNAILYCSGYRRQVNETTYQRAQFGNLKSNFRGVVDDYFKQSLPFSIAGMGTAAVSKQDFMSTGGFTEDVTHGEDIELWVTLALKGKVALYNKPTVIHKLNTENRVSNLETKAKVFADFSKFEEETSNTALKIYLDNNRYSIALSYKLSGHRANYKLWLSKIDLKNLNAKQRLLLRLPQGIVLSLKKAHQLLSQYGLYVSSFR